MKKIVGTLSLLFIFGIGHSQVLNEKTTTEKFNKLLYYVNNLYVDSVNAEELVEIAIVKMLEELDPHTSYIPADEVKKASEPLKGNFDGIGIQFNVLKDTIFVVQTISGGPSEKIGLMANDKIITVDGEVVAGINIQNSDVIKKLKGPKGTIVTVGVKRGKSKELLDFIITRDEIPIHSVDASYMVASKTGYIKVNRFSANTEEEMTMALVQLKKDGMEDLVLDLQGNGGGYLNTAIWMADEFLSDDKLIVYTEGRAFPRDNRYAKNKGIFEKGRLVVLIDESSASASEIVSGAVQDWDRGMIVGRRSFGKGLVQRPIALPDGSEIRLTMQKYYTPSGRCIQAIDYSHRNADGSVGKVPDSLKSTFYTKNGRPVFDGGGVNPDIHLEPKVLSELAKQLISEGVIFDYATSYYFSHENDMPTESFIISDEVYTSFLGFVKKSGFSYRNEAEDALSELESLADNEHAYASLSGALRPLRTLVNKKNASDLFTFKEQIKNELALEILSRYHYDKVMKFVSFEKDQEVQEALKLFRDMDRYNAILKGK